MTRENVTEPDALEPGEPQPAKAVDDRLVDEPASRAPAENLWLTGEDRLLEGKITDHLGYDKRDPAGRTAATATTAPAPRPC
ncbi:hypothetical protein ACFSJS_06420 [Streptomyces desertarenae]|uniref:Transposase n=1 Tax=Streptomyces desertarenae TaxID=2666184 RepID=A0ABW4PGV3_9ACTN